VTAHPLRHRRPLVAGAALLFAAITAARFAGSDPTQPIALLYVLPIGVMATGLGMRAGLLAAAVASALLLLWGSTESLGLGAGWYLSRAITFFLLAGLVGRLADRNAIAERRARRWFQMSRDLLCEVTFDGHFIHLNDAWHDTLGWSREELMSKSYLEFIHPADVEATISASTQGMTSELVSFENRYRAKDGSWRWLLWSTRPDHDHIHAAGKDITERKQLEQLRARQLEHSEATARTDPLTSLPNRRAWDEELRREAARARRLGVPLAVALLDLDHFKHYNDEHGHQAGDSLLQEAAKRWQSAMRTTDFVARYGGEEFGVLLPACDPGEVQQTVERIREGTPAPQTASAGVAVWDGGESMDALVRRADMALYQAKRRGRARTVVADCGAATGLNERSPAADGLHTRFPVSPFGPSRPILT
jgi:diguanylate cyclase (GGDEF)-like protein/PAS domain S-box-containing protein